MSHNVRWTAAKIAQRLQLLGPLVHRRRAPLRPFRYRSLPDPSSPSLAGHDVDDSQWPTVAVGDLWGEAEIDFVLRSRFRFPPDWDPALPAALLLRIGDAADFVHPEAMVYVDGAPWAAVNRYEHEAPLAAAWRDGKEHLLALRGFTGLGQGDGDDRVLAQPLRLGDCALVQIHEPTRAFLVLARIALGTAQAMDENDPIRWQLLNALDAAFMQLDTRAPLGEVFYASVPSAHETLRDGIAAAGPPHLAAITATGHAHLDLAWLWTLAQARRKAGRTFYNVIRHMKQFPGYHFTQSQPQLYEFVRQDDPALFAAIKQHVAEGRWEPIGGMWVEADCNLSGPEALARQLLLGQTWLREQFGAAASPVLWLPDVFGYAWNLPQLIKAAGLDYFFTIKIGWSQYNRMPYDSFWWQGLDGTKVLTHFSTTPDPGGYSHGGTYNAELTPASALGTWRNFQQKEAQRELLMAFGYGDGGGGPDRTMLENLNALASFPGMPRVRAGAVIDFFRRLEAESGAGLPVWNGELYLELHRGTYTSQSRNKRANRKSEFLLHDAEFVAAVASVLAPGYGYPATELRRAWELLCLNQFHDILPGSSIRQVYDESLRQYEEVAALGTGARATALQAVATRVGGDWLVVNPTGFVRDDLVFWEESFATAAKLHRADGSPVLTQQVPGGMLVAPGAVAPYSVTPLIQGATPAPPALPPLIATPTLLENERLRVELDERGEIARLYDKRHERDVLAAGTVGNQLQLFEDRPLRWDAWDVDIFYDDRVWHGAPADEVRVVAAGPLRATVEVRRRILHSTVVQRISLDYDSACLVFATSVDWRERHMLLKVAFAVNVLAPTATYEIQWGNVERPTHRNTSWDWARFESCAQKWVDLSEGDYGVSLLNDCKYGHDIHDNVMRLSLLRAPTHPDPAADQGEHTFTYALLPHRGRWGAATLRAAYALNDPLFIVRGSGDAPTAGNGISLIAADRSNLVLETVKRAEDGDGIIVRLYEAMRQRGTATLRASFPLRAAFRTNLLEENEAALAVSGYDVSVSFRPYEIITLRLLPAA